MPRVASQREVSQGGWRFVDLPAYEKSRRASRRRYYVEDDAVTILRVRNHFFSDFMIVAGKKLDAGLARALWEKICPTETRTDLIFEALDEA